MKALLILLLSCGIARADGFAPHPGAAVPLDGVFRDAEGAVTTLRAAMGGEPAVLLLGYHTCPNLCGTVRADLLRALPRDARAVAVSIDPAETPRDAARARDADGASPLRYLVGDAAPIAASVGFDYRRDDRDAQFLHPAGLVVLTGRGVVSGYLLGVGYAPADIAAALARAAAGQVAAAPSPILLLCFHYDAATGRYSLAIERVTRLAAVLTVAVIGGGLLWLHRGRRA